MDRTSVAGEGEGRFADLVYADDQWLRGEFAALIEASFGTGGREDGPSPRHK